MKLSDDNTYARQKKYISKALEIYKRITLLVPKNREGDIKKIAKKMRKANKTNQPEGKRMKKLLLTTLLLLSSLANAQEIDWNKDTTQDNHYDYTDHNYNEYQAGGQASIDAAHKYDADRLESQRQEQRWIETTTPAERMPDYSYPVK